MTAVAACAGILVIGGMWLAVTSWRPVAHLGRVSSPSLRARAQHWDQRRMLGAVGVALVALVVTRWPVAIIAGGVIGWFAFGTTATRARRRDDARTEAIALWAEMLRDAIGSARGVEGVLIATAATAPEPIRPEVQRMAERLAHEPLAIVLDELADELHHPIGDLVVTALRLASTSGGRQVREVLSDLAATAYAEAESRRRVDVARERPRAALRYTAWIITGFVVLLVVFSRTYLEPYGTVIGQVVLCVVAGYWAAGFWWMHRMARVTPVERFLTRTERP